MAMFHLDYPRKKAFYQWDELACLARALGFPGEIFYNNIPEEYLVDNDDNGLKLKLILWLINIQKVFNQAVDKTINIHTDEWNICVIKKALHLLDINALTFEELHGIRVAFQTYEKADTKGLPLNERTLQRTLKLCNRMISPLKMMQRIKHMKDDFDEPGRIQLHEFLDLILWCEIFEAMATGQPDLDIKRDEDVDLYNIENFESMLTHYDELLAQKLNDEYRADELTFVKEKHMSKAMPKDLPPVDPEKRKRLVSFHTDNYQYLKNELTISQKNCHQTKAGYVRSRPITAPDLIMYDAVDQGYRVSTLDPRPATVFETIGHLIPPVPGKKSPTTLSDIKDIVPRPDVTRYRRPTTPAALSKYEEVDHVHRMETLDFEIATVDHKYEQILMEEMDVYMPGYRDKKAKKPKVERSPSPVVKEPVEIVPSQETLIRLSYHHKREPPRPSHGHACDARYRGWHKSKVKRGTHNILVAPYFERSNTGLLYNKLRQKMRNTGNVDTFVHRHTKPEEVRPEKPRSRAKKYFRPGGIEGQRYPESYSHRSYESGFTNNNNMKKVQPDEIQKPEVMQKAISHLSVSSSNGKESSDVSWRHLKVYNHGGGDTDQDLNEFGKKTSDKADTELPPGKMVELGTVGRVEVLERIKEESGRTTRQSGIHGKQSKTPLEMSQLTKTIESKLSTSTPKTDVTHHMTLDFTPKITPRDTYPTTPKTAPKDLYPTPGTPKTAPKDLYHTKTTPKTTPRDSYHTLTTPKTAPKDSYHTLTTPKTAPKDSYHTQTTPKTAPKDLLYHIPTTPKTAPKDLYHTDTVGTTPKTAPSAAGLQAIPVTPKTAPRDLHNIPPITPSQGTAQKSKGVKVQTPSTQALNQIGFNSERDVPMKTSTGNDTLRKNHNRIKLKCLKRLSMRIDGLASTAMHNKLMNVNLESIGLPNPGGEKWSSVGGGLGLTISI